MNEFFAYALEFVFSMFILNLAIKLLFNIDLVGHLIVYLQSKFSSSKNDSDDNDVYDED